MDDKIENNSKYKYGYREKGISLDFKRMMASFQLNGKGPEYRN